MATTIKKQTLEFLKDLKLHNIRDWFNQNKDKFIAANENFVEFTQELIDRVASFDKSLTGLLAKDARVSHLSRHPFFKR